MAGGATGRARCQQLLVVTLPRRRRYQLERLIRMVRASRPWRARNTYVTFCVHRNVSENTRIKQGLLQKTDRALAR